MIAFMLMNRRAALWYGTAGSWVDLHAVLPPQFRDSEATGISRDATTIYITGVGLDESSTSKALLWTLPAPPLSCSPADIVSIGGLPPRDGLVTGDDFVMFISFFALNQPLADITGIGGPPAGPDGLITGDDFVAFIAAFASGCP